VKPAGAGPQYEAVMDNTTIIIKPLITEKSDHLRTTRNAYTFEVHPEANKHQIRQAVEELYSVKVLDVRTMNRKGKPRRTRYRMSRTKAHKRAIVVLAPEYRIDLF